MNGIKRLTSPIFTSPNFLNSTHGPTEGASDISEVCNNLMQVAANISEAIHIRFHWMNRWSKVGIEILLNCLCTNLHSFLVRIYIKLITVLSVNFLY